MPPEVNAVPTSTAGVTGTPASAPTASAPAPSGDAPSSSPTDADTGTPPAAPSTEEAPPTDTPPEFDFDAWDGEDYEVLPDPHKKVATKVHERWEKKHKDAEDQALELREQLREAQENRSLYDALLAGDPDPRIAQAEARATAAERQILEQIAAFENEKKQWGEEKTGWESWQKEQAKKYAESFRQRHPEFESNEELRKEIVRLMKAGWDDEVAADLLIKHPKEVWAEAERLRSEGVPDQHAVKFALATYEKQKAEAPQPRPGAQITAGATGSGHSAPARTDSLSTARSFAQKRQIAISNSMARARRKAG